MKKIFVLILPFLLLTSCQIPDVTTVPSSNSTSNEAETTSKDIITESSLNDNTSSTIEETTSEDKTTTSDTTTGELTTIDPSTLDEYSKCVPSKYITTASEIKEYYSSITDNMSGTTLQKALGSLIENHTRRDYDNLEADMKIADRNWQASPDENDQNPYMNLLYYTKNNDSSLRQTWDKYHSSNNPGNPQMWDKEHIWAKSNGFPSKGKLAYSDLHHLRAADMKNNNSRSSLPFGNVTTSASSIMDFSSTASGKKGKCNGVAVYEPKDEFKGDVARALFYMATRYASSDGIKLSLTNGTDSSGSKWGFLNTLLEWNKQDLPDSFEIRRNDIIYKEMQHNRNPFIDNPDFADRIYA